MERCAVFVDAGWFLAESAQALTGTGSRWSIEYDYARLTTGLGQLAQQLTQLPLLRIYWYDAAADGIPTADHLHIAGLKDVKLRLGRISHSQQKGVDALLILDLTTLARERAIASALVISGDEDIREGIASAQGLGVRVTIGGVAMAEGRPSLATTLIHEADDQFLIDLGFLSKYARVSSVDVHRLPAVGVGPAVSGKSALPASSPASSDSSRDTIVVAARGAGSAGERAAVGARDPRTFGYTFGATYADELNDSQLRQLQREAPEIPANVAARLFREAEKVFGETRGRPELRRELRTGFWDHVMNRRND
jgi:uncharacterized LabA/DUF88 family protein